MGGMAAFIPAKDPAQAELVLAKVRKDKELEAANGHDGTWVAHPGLADVAMEIFDRYIPASKPNQLHVRREQDAPVTQAELLAPCEGTRTEAGMRTNLRVSLQYMAAWMGGNGCVPIYGLMEDAATAEISRASIWQWIRNAKQLDNGVVVTPQLFLSMMQQEAAVVRAEVGESAWQQGQFEQAQTLLEQITTADTLVDFLTLPAYQALS